MEQEHQLPEAGASRSPAEKAREHSIIVPLDGKEASLSAIPVARELARLAGATLHFVHVDGQAAGAALPQALKLPREQAEGAVFDQRSGPSADQILTLARERNASFIVLTTNADAGTPGKGLGHTAESILEHAPCPVIFVPPARGAAPWRFQSALVPHDGTPTTSGAIPPMVRLLKRAGASLRVLFVMKAAESPEEAGALPVPRYVDQPQHEWPSWTAEFLERFQLQNVPGMRFFVTAGEPGPEILKAAREHAVDLVVLGWRGTLTTQRAVVLQKILAQAPCPVLVFRVTPAGH